MTTSQDQHLPGMQRVEEGPVPDLLQMLSGLVLCEECKENHHSKEYKTCYECRTGG